MATTFTKIATIELTGGAAANMDFTSIPSTYTDLCLKVTARDSSTNNLFTLQFNGDTSTANYSTRYLYGSGSGSPSSGSNSAWYVAGITNPSGNTASTFASTEFYIPNYAGSTQKSVSTDGVQENNATGAWAWLSASIWTGTAAINRITIAGISANFAQYSSATLYGISKS